MSIGARERRTLNIVILSIAILIGYLLGLRPLVGLAQKSRKEKELMLEVAAARRLLASASLISARRAQLAKALDAVGKDFISGAGGNEAGLILLQTVEGIAIRSGLKLQTRSIRSVEGDGTQARIRVEVVGMGDSHAVIGFLLGLCAARFRLEIESLDLRPMDGRAVELRAVVATLLPGGVKEGEG